MQNFYGNVLNLTFVHHLNKFIHTCAGVPGRSSHQTVLPHDHSICTCTSELCRPSKDALCLMFHVALLTSALRPFPELLGISYDVCELSSLRTQVQSSDSQDRMGETHGVWKSTFKIPTDFKIQTINSNSTK